MSAAGFIVGSVNEPSAVMDNKLVDLIDLNRDGLPDILKTDLYGGAHTCTLNLGMRLGGEHLEVVWDQPRNVASPDGLALLLDLSSDRVHLADMDGDGISDLVHTTFANDVYTYLNRGNLSWGQRKKMSTQDTAPPAPFAYDEVKTSDLDFDKRIDIVKSTENGYSLWFNSEEGKYSREVRTGGAIHQGKVLLFSDKQVHLSDLNGDRMNDVARITPTRVVSCPNMGYGRFDACVEMLIPDVVLTDGEGGQVERARLEDLNGGGLSDLVVERAAANELWYWLNLGTDAFSNKYVIADMPTQFGPNMTTRWADINGNGSTDLIYADSDASHRLRILDVGQLVSGSAHPNLLTGIDNGLGVRTAVSYRSSTEYYREAREAEAPWSSTLPFPVSVVAKVVTSTGLDLDGEPGKDEYLREYVYRDGYYDDYEKAFRGFREVRVIEYGDTTAPTRTTLHHFFTGGPDSTDNDADGTVDEVSPEGHREEEALKGKVRRLEVRSENDFLYWTDENRWQVKNLLVNPDGIEVRFAFNPETDKLVYGGSNVPETLKTTYTYDDFGNVVEEKNYGALSLTGDEIFTTTEFINQTDSWILGKPKHQIQTDGAGQKVAESFSYYDGEDYVGLALGALDKGNLTRQEGWVSENTTVDLIRNRYDAFGNIIGIMDGNRNQRSIAYDPLFHTLPVQETIHVGEGRPDLTLTVEYNPGLSVITQSTDFNGHSTAYDYDCFGRLVQITKPGDSPQFPTQTFAYTLSDPQTGMIYSYDPSGNLTSTSGTAKPSSIRTSVREVSGQSATFDTLQYVDGQGRKLALHEEAEEGFVVREAVLFNSKGTPRFAFLPYAAESSEYIGPIFDQSQNGNPL